LSEYSKVKYIGFPQRNRANRIKKRRFVAKIGSQSHDYRDPEVPPSAIYKQENQKRWWYNSVCTRRPEIRGEWLGVQETKAQNQEILCLKEGEDGHPSLRENLPFLHSRERMMLAHVVAKSTLCADSNAYLFWKHPHKFTQK
jgi:hypothetical protein